VTELNIECWKHDLVRAKNGAETLGSESELLLRKCVFLSCICYIRTRNTEL